MAYIDCENCYHGKVCQYRRIYHDMVVVCEHWQPTADVVPKSEVNLKGELAIAERHEKDARALFKEAVIQLQNARKDVARKIFEEIYEDCFDQYGYINYEALAELKKKYTGGE